MSPTRPLLARLSAMVCLSLLAGAVAAPHAVAAPAPTAASGATADVGAAGSGRLAQYRATSLLRRGFSVPERDAGWTPPGAADGVVDRSQPLRPSTTSTPLTPEQQLAGPSVVATHASPSLFEWSQQSDRRARDLTIAAGVLAVEDTTGSVRHRWALGDVLGLRPGAVVDDVRAVLEPTSDRWMVVGVVETGSTTSLRVAVLETQSSTWSVQSIPADLAGGVIAGIAGAVVDPSSLTVSLSLSRSDPRSTHRLEPFASQVLQVDTRALEVDSPATTAVFGADPSRPAPVPAVQKPGRVWLAARVDTGIDVVALDGTPGDRSVRWESEQVHATAPVATAPTRARDPFDDRVLAAWWVDGRLWTASRARCAPARDGVVVDGFGEGGQPDLHHVLAAPDGDVVAARLGTAGAAIGAVLQVHSSSGDVLRAVSSPGSSPWRSLRVPPRSSTVQATLNPSVVAAAPVVTKVSPLKGSTTGGTLVTVTGTGLTGATSVSFGGTPGTSVTVVSATKLTVVSPAHAKGVVDVRVTTSGGTSAVVTADRFTFALPPSVSSVSPASGPTSGGTVVTITGVALSGATAVRFGTVAATGFTQVSATSISATAPAQAAGVVDVRVTTAIGTSPVVSADTFTYTGTATAPTVTSVAPASGPTSGGTSITIAGTGFTGATAVRLGTTAVASYTVVSATSITALTPALSAGAYVVKVVTAAGTSTGTATFTPTASPVVTGVTPSSGNDVGGTRVTVSGSGLTGATSVAFGGVAGTSITVAGDTSLSVTAPAHAAGVVDIVVSGPSGSSAASASDRFTYLDTTPPSAPTGLVGSPAAGRANLGWNAVTATDLAGYRVYRSTGAGTRGALVTTVPAGTTSYSDTGLSNGSTYYYSLTAYDASGNESAASSQVAVTPTTVNGTSRCGHVTSNTTWSTGSVQVLTCDVVVDPGVTLTISPGVVVKARYTSLVVNGALVASGTAASPVTFTSLQDDTVGGDTNLDAGASTPSPGDWGGVVSAEIDSTNPPQVTLSRATYRYASASLDSGSDDSRAPGYVARSVAVTYVTFEHASGVTLSGVGSLRAANNTFTALSSDAVPAAQLVVRELGVATTATVAQNSVSGPGVAVGSGVVGPAAIDVLSSSSAAPVVQSNTVTNSFAVAVRVSAAVLTASTLTGNTGSSTTRVPVLELSGHLTSSLTAPLTGLQLAIGSNCQYRGLTVDPGVTLTLGAGTVTKVNSACGTGSLTVNGSLVMAGASGNPAAITSMLDDSVGGDTNADSASSTPRVGDWDGIRSSVTDSTRPATVTIDHAQVRYGSLNLDTGSDDERLPGYVARAASVTSSDILHGVVSMAGLGQLTATGNTITETAGDPLGRTLLDVESQSLTAGVTVSANTVLGSGATANSGFVSEAAIDVEQTALSSYGQSSSVEPTVSNNTVGNTSAVAVRVSADRLQPSRLSGNTGTGTAKVAVLELSGTLVGDLSLPAAGLPVALGSRYQHSDLVVGPGTTMTVGAGVVVKSNPTYWTRTGGLVNNGTLVVAGTSASPTFFTSIKDDSVGGDTNNDGTLTSPQIFEWGGISSDVIDSAAPASLDMSFATVSWANLSADSGRDDERDPTYAPRHVSITRSTFLHGSGLQVQGVGAVTVSNNNITAVPADNAPAMLLSVTYGGLLYTPTVSGNTVSGGGPVVDTVGGSLQDASVEVVSTGQMNCPYSPYPYCQRQSVLPVVTNNTISTTSAAALRVSADNLSAANLTGNTAGAGVKVPLLELQGDLVDTLSLPMAGLTVAIDGTTRFYRGLVVDPGAALNLAAGVVLKVDGPGGLDVNGVLRATGSAASPVVVTSIMDDSVGGDTNNDGTQSAPGSGSWSGIRSSVSDEMQPASVNLDHTRVLWGGVRAYTGAADERDPNFVARSFSLTSSEVSHGTVSVSGVGDVTVTGTALSVSKTDAVGQTLLDIRHDGILSSVTVSGDTLTDPTTTANNGYVSTAALSVQSHGYYSTTVTAPVVSANTVTSAAMAISVSADTLRPSSLTGNVAGTGDKVPLLELDGQLVGNLSLPQPGLTVALGGPLVVNPGVTMTVGAGTWVKANSPGAGLTVQGRLVVNGTTAAPVTFTSIMDDSVAGDTNWDGTRTTPAPCDWSGITVDGGSLASSSLQVQYACTAVAAARGATTTVRGRISHNQVGLQGSPDALIDAKSVDWGTPSGPAPYGLGDAVNEFVVASPWQGEAAFRGRYAGWTSGGFAGSSYGSYAYWHRRGADPVDVATGAFVLGLTDVTVPEPGVDLTFARTYSSQSFDAPGALGGKWMDNWETRLVLPTTTSPTYDVHWGDGRIDPYTAGPAGPVAAAGNYTSLSALGSGWVATTKDRTAYTFDSAGRLTTVGDPNGNTLTITRTAGGQVQKVADGAGRTLTMAYDASGRVTSVTDPAGKTTTYAYSSAGMLSGVTDPTGATTGYSYDSDGNLLGAMDANGDVDVTNTYDTQGRVVTQANALGATTTFTYEDVVRRTTKTDPLGGRRVYTRDVEGRLLSETDPAGHTVYYAYDAAGNTKLVYDSLGQISRSSYDARGNVVSSADGAGRTSTMTYDATDHLTSSTDGSGAVTTYTYDSRGNLVKRTDPSGRSMTQVVDARGLVTSQTSPGGVTTTRTYSAQGDLAGTTDAFSHSTAIVSDLMGRPTSVTDPGGGTTSYTYSARGETLTVSAPAAGTVSTRYDPAGNVISRTDALGRVTSVGYDAADEKTTVTDAAGGTTGYAYDANGNLTARWTPSGSQTTYGYDADNRLVTTTSPLGAVTTTSYTVRGEVATVTDPTGGVTSYQRDLSGKVIALVDPLGRLTTQTYDADGRPRVYTDARGHAWTSTSDAQGRLVGTSDPLGRTWAYTYDGDGRILTAVDALSQTSTYTYDAAGRRTSAAYGDGTSATYTYDALDRVTGRTDSAGAASYSYDAAGRLTGTSNGAGATLAMTYDAAGQVLSRTVGGAQTTYSYEPRGLVVKAVDPAGTATWGYDADGRLVSVALPRSVSATIGYDADGRQTSIAWSGGVSWAQTASYDAAGRVTGQSDPSGTHTFSYDAKGELVQDAFGAGSTQFAYDEVGNRTSVSGASGVSTSTYDAADQILTSGTQSFTHDGDGRLVTIKDSADSSTTTLTWSSTDQLRSLTDSTGTVRWTRDDAGLLVGETGPAGTTTFVSDPTSPRPAPLARTTAGVTTRVPAGPTLWAAANGTSVTSLVTDHLGSVRRAVGSAVSSTEYDVWGTSTGAVPSVPGFEGSVVLPHGLVAMGARIYSAAWGRFLTPDPTGSREVGSMGPYVFVRDDPASRVDPTGAFSISGFLGGLTSWASSTWHSLGSAALSVAAAVTSVGIKVSQAIDTATSWVGARFASLVAGARGSATRCSTAVARQDGGGTTFSMGGEYGPFSLGTDGFGGHERGVGFQLDDGKTSITPYGFSTKYVDAGLNFTLSTQDQHGDPLADVGSVDLSLGASVHAFHGYLGAEKPLGHLGIGYASLARAGGRDTGQSAAVEEGIQDTYQLLAASGYGY